VLNNGAGIPVEVHKTEGIYVPELIFGNLLTSSNYNDNEKKVGRGAAMPMAAAPCSSTVSSTEAHLRLIMSAVVGCPLPSLAQVTGGRNGYGAKLANIFSSKFVVETCDGKRRRRYKQAFSSNMTKKGEPVITCAGLLAGSALIAAVTAAGLFNVPGAAWAAALCADAQLRTGQLHGSEVV
jgi:DNA topoisomerase-2